MQPKFKKSDRIKWMMSMNDLHPSNRHLDPVDKGLILNVTQDTYLIDWDDTSQVTNYTGTHYITNIDREFDLDIQEMRNQKLKSIMTHK